MLLWLVYRQISNITCILIGNKMVDHSDVDGASPVQLQPHSRLKSWLEWIGQRKLQDKTTNIIVLGFDGTLLEVWRYSCFICITCLSYKRRVNVIRSTYNEILACQQSSRKCEICFIHRLISCLLGFCILIGHWFLTQDASTDGRSFSCRSRENNIGHNLAISEPLLSVNFRLTKRYSKSISLE